MIAAPSPPVVPAAPSRTSLPAPYDTPPSAEGPQPTPATLELVRSQVDALLAASPGYQLLGSDDRRRLREDMTRISAYLAELVRDAWWQAESHLGQRPLVRSRLALEEPLATAEGVGDFEQKATAKVASTLQETIRAVAFPSFVADLINGTFNAILGANTKQVEQFANLLTNVSKTVDQYSEDNVSDDEANRWLVANYPKQLKLDDSGKAVPIDGADQSALPDFQRDLGLSEQPALDEGSIADVLVPGARRRLAQGRLQVLSTMVLMGINRITVTAGRLRAAMGIHIDATDRTAQEQYEKFGVEHKGEVSVPLTYVTIAASHTITYVRSTHADSQSELNVNTDLTGEVEIHFRSDFFPLQRFATDARIGQIQANTPNPAANPPASPTVQDQPIPWGPSVTMPQAGRAAPQQNVLTGDAIKAPVAPDLPTMQLPAPTGSGQSGNKSNTASPAAPAAKGGS